MAGSLVESTKLEGGVSASASPIEALFHRRIEFHPARKPFSTISSSGGDFYLEILNPSSDSHRPASGGAPTGAVSSSQSLKRSDDGEFSEHLLDPELSLRTTFRRIGAGLANLGNTCFLNSVLQCLTYTEPFAAYLKSGKHKSSCHTAGFCAMCALQNHVVAALQSTGRIMSPSHLVKNLRCISRNFRTSRQEDAHEYMVNLLESMHKCCLPSGIPSESPSAYERSLVHKIFGGRLRSQVKCTQCSYCSNKFDPFLDLSLEIVKADSLRKALMRFTAVEQLDGGEKQYYCQCCKEKVRALKQLTVHKAPHVLTIHLKRFGSSVPGQKIDKRVEFGPTLDLKPFVSDPHEGDLKYTLYGVLVHAGWSTHSGHYYCFVRTSSGMWHSLNDNQVFQVSEKTVLEQKAYMLFYVRDRSSVIKRPVDVAQKENITANAPGNKEIPPAASGLKRAIQNVFVERKADTSEHDAATSKCEATPNGRSIFVTVAPSEYPLLKDAPALQNNGHNMQKQSPFLQSTGHVILKEGSVLQTNGHAIAQGLQQRALSNGPAKLASLENSLLKRPHVVTTTGEQAVAEDLVQSAQLKENSIATTSCTDDATFIPESARTSHGKDHLPNGCNSEVKGVGMLVALPNKCGFWNHTEKLLTETGMHEKGDAGNDTPRKIVGDYESEKIGSSKLSSQPSAINGSVQQNVVLEDKRYSSNLQFQNTGRSQLKKNRLVNLSKKPSISSACVGKEALAVSDTKCSFGDCYLTDLKQKKLAKCSLVRNMPFGRKRLFLASLSLRKKKKHKRMRKRRIDSVTITKSKAVEDLNLDDQVTSTSEGVMMVGVDSMCSRNKRTHSDSNIENSIQQVKDAHYCNGGSVNTNDRDVGERSGKTSVMLSTFEQPKRSLSSAVSQYDAIETDTREKSSIQHGIMSLLMRGLEETTVARWDDGELPSSQINGLNGTRNSSIGYVLDEWDEEYDRGKRKKVKQSSDSFGGLNLFQKTATIKAQQKMEAKMGQIRSGNQPLRI